MAKKNVNTGEAKKKLARAGTAAPRGSAASPKEPPEAVQSAPAPAAPGGGAVQGEASGSGEGAGTVEGAVIFLAASAGVWTLTVEEPQEVIVEVCIDLKALSDDQRRRLELFLTDVPNTFKVTARGKSPRG